MRAYTADSGSVKGANQLARAAVYIDGFNLFYAIRDLGEQHLKWCNYWQLSEQLLQPDETLEAVKVATAFHPDNEKKIRHTITINALENVGVTILRGHYVNEDTSCKKCGNTWRMAVEKEGDINLAIALINDAHSEDYDSFYLVTSDTDQAATARLFNTTFPNKRLVSVSPPGRVHSQHITKYCTDTARITKPMVEQCLFPQYVPGTGGRVMAKRPPKFAPPEGWLPPGITLPAAK